MTRDSEGVAFLKALVLPLRGRALLITAGLALLAHVPHGLGAVVAWVVVVLLSALIVEQRGAGDLPMPTRLDQPGLVPLWQRALATCALVESPLLVMLGLGIVAPFFPDDPFLEAIMPVLLPICGFLTFIAVGFIPGALIVAVREEGRDPVMLMLVPSRVTRANAEAIPALVVAVVGFFFMFLGFALIQAVLPESLWPASQMAVIVWWHLAIAAVTALCLPGPSGQPVLRS